MTSAPNTMERRAAFPVCGTCGGGDLVRDAWASWDPELQCWTLGAVFDNVTCHACGTETEIKWRHAGAGP